MSNNYEKNKGFSITAVFLILLGVIFLLNNFGVLSWNLWQNVWKFWPVLLILFGVEIVLGRASSPKSFGLLLVLIFLVPIVLVLNPLTGNPLARKSIQFQEPLGNLTKAEFNFRLPSANLNFKAADANSTDLLKAKINYSQILPKPKLTENRHFGEVSYTIDQENLKNLPFSNNIGNSGEVKLSWAIPLDLAVKSSTGVYKLDLKGLRVVNLDIQTTAGGITILFAKDFSTKVFLKTEASVVSLNIPKEVGSKLTLNSKIKTLNIDQTSFKKVSGNTYQSNNFDQQQNKVQIEITGAASTISVKST